MKATSKLAASIRAAAGLVAAATLTISTTTFAQPPGPAGETFKVVTVAEGLRNPWSMAWLPNGDMLVTERGSAYPGRCASSATASCCPSRCRRAGRARARPRRHAGSRRASELRAEPLHLSELREAERNDGKEGTTALTRAKLEDDKLVDAKEIFEAKAWNDAPGHFGARIAFDGQGHLFLSVGDRMAGLFPRPRTARWIRISKATRRRGSTTTRARSCA